MTTISEFIAGNQLEETIVSNCPKYRDKFSKLIKKAGLDEKDMEDKEAVDLFLSGRIPMNQSSWNWAGFFLFYYWAIYRKIKLGWGILIASMLLSLFDFFFGPVLPGSAFIGLNLAISFTFATLGNVYLLRNSVVVCHKTTSRTDREQRSTSGVLVAIIITIAWLAIEVGISPPVASVSVVPAVHPKDPAATATTDNSCSAAGLDRALAQQEGLPEAVAATRNQIIELAVTCDFDGLSALGLTGLSLFRFAVDGGDDPAQYWRSMEGDHGVPVTRDILEALNFPFAAEKRAGLLDEGYIWPSLVRMVEPGREPSKAEYAALRGNYDAEAIDEAVNGIIGYSGLKVVIQADGDWTRASYH